MASSTLHSLRVDTAQTHHSEAFIACAIVSKVLGFVGGCANERKALPKTFEKGRGTFSLEYWTASSGTHHPSDPPEPLWSFLGQVPFTLSFHRASRTSRHQVVHKYGEQTPDDCCLDHSPMNSRQVKLKLPRFLRLLVGRLLQEILGHYRRRKRERGHYKKGVFC